MDRFRLKLKLDGTVLTVREPNPADLRENAATFAAWYSDERNSRMMGGRRMTSDEAFESFEEATVAGNRVFFLEVNGKLAGDADFRRIEPPTCEFAIMIGSHETQGKGFGTAFCWMLHHLAFHHLGFETIYLTIVPQNSAGLRCYTKVGYAVDAGPAAARYKEAKTEIAMSVTHAMFERVQSGWLSRIEIERY